MEGLEGFDGFELLGPTVAAHNFMKNLKAKPLLHRLAATGDFDELREALDKGAPVDQVSGGYRPLHLAALFGHPKKVELLVQRGADLHSPDAEHGYSPLHLAADAGSSEAAAMLLDLGADVNLQLDNKSDRWTPLMVATNMDHPRVMKLLLERNADISLKSKTGRLAEDLVDGMFDDDGALKDAYKIMKEYTARQFSFCGYTLDLRKEQLRSSGVVEYAFDTAHNREVVLKFCSTRHEAELLKGVQAHIPKCEDLCGKCICSDFVAKLYVPTPLQATSGDARWGRAIFEDETTPPRHSGKTYVLAMERGTETLRDLMTDYDDRGKPVELQTVNSIFLQLVDGLVALQSNHLVHGDISYGNVLSCQGRWRLIDFESVHKIPTMVKQQQAVMLRSTLLVCPPEVAEAVIEGKLCFMSYTMHQWQLGIILYRLVFGHEFLEAVDHMDLGAPATVQHSPDDWRRRLLTLAIAPHQQGQEAINRHLEDLKGSSRERRQFVADAASLLQKLLVLNPQARLPLEKVRGHRLLSGTLQASTVPHSLVKVSEAITQLEIRVNNAQMRICEQIEDTAEAIIGYIEDLRLALDDHVAVINDKLLEATSGLRVAIKATVNVDMFGRSPRFFIIRPHTNPSSSPGSRAAQIVNFFNRIVKTVDNIIKLDFGSLLDYLTKEKWELVLLCEQCRCETRAYVVPRWRRSLKQLELLRPLLHLSINCLSLSNDVVGWVATAFSPPAVVNVVSQQIAQAVTNLNGAASNDIFEDFNVTNEGGHGPGQFGGGPDPAALTVGMQQFQALLATLDPRNEWSLHLTKATSVYQTGEVVWVCNKCSAGATNP